jgi:membrane protease YdiL (CAAX protease family)
VRPRLPRRGQLTSGQLAFLLGWAWVEEVIWRRLLLATVAVVAGVAAGLVATTALFALAHAQGRASHLLTGAAFGGAFVATGRLGAAVASHAVYNLLVAGSREGGGAT